MTTAIILAAGKSERMGGGVDKAFISLIDKPVVAWALMAFEKCADIDRIVLVVRKEQVMASKAVVKMFGISKVDKIVAGGTKRQESVAAGLAACDLDTRYVVIHDGARPLVTPDLISEVVKAVKRAPAVTVGRPVIDTLKACEKGMTVTEMARAMSVCGTAMCSANSKAFARNGTPVTARVAMRDTAAAPHRYQF